MSEEETVLYTTGEKVGGLLAKIWESWSDDKHISWTEIGSVAISGGALVISMFSNFKELKVAFADGVTNDEIDELKAGLYAGYQLSDKTTEAEQEYIIDKAVALIEAIVCFFDKDDKAE